MVRRKNTIVPMINNDEPKKIHSELKCIIRPKTDEQRLLMKTIDENVITLVDGPAGTGKTLLSVFYGIQLLFNEKVSNIIFSRPTVEAASERLGWLPGEAESKLSVYMYPIFDALSQIIHDEQIRTLCNKNGNPAVIKTIPLAYMRGTSFRNSYIVLDESQNTNQEQMRMIMTRIGTGSKLVCTGDSSQSDLGERNGHLDALRRFGPIAKEGKGIGVVKLTEASILRHPIIALVEETYRKKM